MRICCSSASQNDVSCTSIRASIDPSQAGGPVVSGFGSPVYHKDDLRATQSAGAVVHLAHLRTPSVAVIVQLLLARKGLLSLWRSSGSKARQKHGTRPNFGRTIV